MSGPYVKEHIDENGHKTYNLTPEGRAYAETLPPLEDLKKAYRKARRAQGLPSYLWWRTRLWIDYYFRWMNRRKNS